MDTKNISIISGIQLFENNESIVAFYNVSRFCWFNFCVNKLSQYLFRHKLRSKHINNKMNEIYLYTFTTLSAKLSYQHHQTVFHL